MQQQPISVDLTARLDGSTALQPNSPSPKLAYDIPRCFFPFLGSAYRF
jgi:hypothetical protein